MRDHLVDGMPSTFSHDSTGVTTNGSIGGNASTPGRAIMRRALTSSASSHPTSDRKGHHE